MRNKPWLKPKYGKKDATWDSKRLTESSRFATLSLRLELEALAAPDDPCSDQDKHEPLVEGFIKPFVDYLLLKNYKDYVVTVISLLLSEKKGSVKDSRSRPYDDSDACHNDCFTVIVPINFSVVVDVPSDRRGDCRTYTIEAGDNLLY
jgi:hypothetical protein